MWSRGVPPLSDQVRVTITQEARTASEAHTPATRPNNQRVVLDEPVQPDDPPSNVITFSSNGRPRQREDTVAQTGRFRIPFTLVAASIMVLLFGGLLFSALFGEPDESPTASQLVETATLAPTGTLDATSTPEADLGILSMPVDTETPSIIPAATQDDAVVQRSQPTWTPPPDRCVARAVADNVDVYSQVAAVDVIATLPLGEYRMVNVYTSVNQGWYELIALEGGIMGWVSAATVVLSGPCSDLAEPSPTITETVVLGVCTVQGVLGTVAEIYRMPVRSADRVQTISDFQAVDVLDRTGTGWYRVNYEMTWVGYVNENDATFSAACRDLDIVSPPLPSETPAAGAAINTPAALNPALRSFAYEADEPVRPGDVISLVWEATGTAGVTIEFYGADVDPGDYGTAEPLATLAGLSASGSVEATIPPSYNQQSVVYVLFIDAQQASPTPILGGIVTVPISLD